MSSKISASTTSGTALNMSADTSGVLEIQTGATPTTAITVDASQNVGIGTTSPAYKLDVVGLSKGSTLQASGTAVGGFSANAWFVQNEGSSTSRVYYCGANTSTYGILEEYAAYSNGTPTRTRYVTSDVQIFYTAAAERMRIDSSGNLLVGGTTANGANTLTIQYNANCPQINFNTGFNGRNSLLFSYNSTQVGSIVTNSGSVSFNTTSDYRLKENIAPMQNALNVVKQLKPVTYTWKATGESTQGFIAHELQEVAPECVTGEKDAVDEEGNPQYQGIDTSFLVATLTAAIQELNVKVTALEAQLGAK